MHAKKLREKDEQRKELERAIELIAKPTQRGNATLKTFGDHPTEKKNITAHDGKFGPYVKCGKINASILGDQSIDSLKLEDAIRLIDERKAKMGLKKTQKLRFWVPSFSNTNWSQNYQNLSKNQCHYHNHEAPPKLQQSHVL